MRWVLKNTTSGVDWIIIYCFYHKGRKEGCSNVINATLIFNGCRGILDCLIRIYFIPVIMKRNHLKADPTVIHKAKVCWWNMDTTGLPRTKCDTGMQSIAGVKVSYSSYSSSRQAFYPDGMDDFLHGRGHIFCTLMAMVIFRPYVTWDICQLYWCLASLTLTYHFCFDIYRN